MKKNLHYLVVIMLSLFFVACSSSKTETAASIAQKWCELNGKAYKAPEGPEKDAAKQKVKDYEQEIEKNHKDDKAFMKEVNTEVEKCEDASEGR